MKAIAIEQYGGPEVLTPMDVPAPQPTDGEVRVKVHAVSINPVDCQTREDNRLQYTDFPVVLGWDIAGVVDAVGAGVSEFRVGDEVFGMIRFPHEGRAYAEYVTAPVSEIARKPQGLSHVEAAAMTLAALTAHQAFDTMQLVAGQTVLIHAAAGGVGHFAVQLAKARGARVIATASAANRDFVTGLGADQVIDYRARPFEEQVANVDAVLVTVLGDTLPRSVAVLKRGGWLVSLTGAPSAEQAEQAGVHAEQIAVHTSNVDLEYLTTLAESGQLKPHISQTFPLEQAAAAHRSQETGRTVGKIVLRVG